MAISFLRGGLADMLNGDVAENRASPRGLTTLAGADVETSWTEHKWDRSSRTTMLRSLRLLIMSLAMTDENYVEWWFFEVGGL